MIIKTILILIKKYYSLILKKSVLENFLKLKRYNYIEKTNCQKENTKLLCMKLKKLKIYKMNIQNLIFIYKKMLNKN